MADMMIYPYHAFVGHLAAEKHNLASDTLKCTLHTADYVPDLAVHDYYNDLTNELPTANGYTAGGLTLTNTAWGYIAAASAPQWAPLAEYKLGQVARKIATNGHVYRCIVPGTSGAAEPVWPTNPGETVVSGTATFAESGTGYWRLDFDDPLWTAAEGTSLAARWGVIYNYSSGAGTTTRALIALIDFLATRTAVNTDFKIIIPAHGALAVFVPR
jgi:hypothetical protein